MLFFYRTVWQTWLKKKCDNGTLLFIIIACWGMRQHTTYSTAQMWNVALTHMRGLQVI